MLCASSSFGHASAAMTMASSPVYRLAGLAPPHRTTLRYGIPDQRLPCSLTSGIQKKMRITNASVNNDDSPTPKTYKEVVKPFREMFAREISTESKDSDISIAKVLLFIAAEDEAFLTFNRELDDLSFLRERGNVKAKTDSEELETVPDQFDEQLLQLDGKSLPEWLSELDAISKQVEAKLLSRGINSCHSIQVLEAVNTVIFDMRGFERKSTCFDEDPKYSYLHSVLNSSCGSAFLFSVIYIEVCQRLGVPIVGARAGEDFLIWPKTENPEEIFEVATASGKSLFAIVNGECVGDTKSMASELTGKSLHVLDIATNRDIIGIALANLIRVHWRRASKPSPGGVRLTSPLSEVNNLRISNIPLLRPQDLRFCGDEGRLAIAAAERLLILEPHNMRLRRDLGMMHYYSRQCREAIRELSICIAFALDEEEAKELTLFVEKLHLLFSMMSSPLDSDRLAVH